MFEKTTIGEWVVIVLSIIYAGIATFSKPINEGGAFVAGTFTGSFIVSLLILYIIYWIITKVFPNSSNWGIILWILAVVFIPLFVIIILAVIVAFIFGMAGSSTNSLQTTEEITYQPIQTIATLKTVAPIPTLIKSSGKFGWVQYTNTNDHFSIYKPSDWSINSVDKSEVMDKSDPLYSQIMNDYVYIFTPNAKGFIMIYGVDFTGTLYSIFNDKEKTQISNEFYDEFIKGIKSAETEELKITSFEKDSNYYVINGNPARRVTIYSQINGQSLSGDAYVIAHGNTYYVEVYFAMEGSTQSDASTASNIMRTFSENT